VDKETMLITISNKIINRMINNHNHHNHLNLINRTKISISKEINNNNHLKITIRII